MQTLRFSHIYLPVLVTIWLGLALDAKGLSESIQHNQWLTNVLTVTTFLWVYRCSSWPVKKMMQYGLVIALGGELLFAIVLGMYTYRLENLPVYVPFGHAIIYAAVHYIVKEPAFRRNQEQIIATLLPLMVAYSAAWLLFAHDLFGFLCMVAILVIFKQRPVTIPFFLVMFFMISYMELIGTYYECWHWPEVWFGLLEWAPSANPPSGISVFYFAFDTGCLWCLRRFHNQKWHRMRNIQRIRGERLHQPV